MDNKMADDSGVPMRARARSAANSSDFGHDNFCGGPAD